MQSFQTNLRNPPVRNSIYPKSKLSNGDRPRILTKQNGDCPHFQFSKNKHGVCPPKQSPKTKWGLSPKKLVDKESVCSVPRCIKVWVGTVPKKRVGSVPKATRKLGDAAFGFNYFVDFLQKNAAYLLLF